MLVDVTGIDLVEMRDDVADFGELGEIDFALADEIEDDCAEVGEGVGAFGVGEVGGAAARAGGAGGEGVVEAFATFAEAFAGGALEGVAKWADLGGGRAEESAECPAERDFGRAEAAAASLPCHASKLYR